MGIKKVKMGLCQLCQGWHLNLTYPLYIQIYEYSIDTFATLDRIIVLKDKKNNKMLKKTPKQMNYLIEKRKDEKNQEEYESIKSQSKKGQEE